MEGCPIHLSFDIGARGIILYMCSQIFGGGTPVAPGNILQNNTSHAVDSQSLCLPSLNAQINSSKAVVQVLFWPILLLNTGVVYMSLRSGILGDEIKNTHGHDVVSFCCPTFGMNLTLISSLV